MGIPIAKIAEGTVPTQKTVEPLYPMLPAEYGDKTDRTEARYFNPSPTAVSCRASSHLENALQLTNRETCLDFVIKQGMYWYVFVWSLLYYLQ